MRRQEERQGAQALCARAGDVHVRRGTRRGAGRRTGAGRELRRAAVPAGNLTVYFRNHDASEHNLWLDPPESGAPAVLISDAVGENGGATRTVAVTPGRWRLYCSLAGRGSMTRDLAVG